jgi:hypothetical protein
MPKPHVIWLNLLHTLASMYGNRGGYRELASSALEVLNVNVTWILNCLFFKYLTMFNLLVLVLFLH